MMYWCKLIDRKGYVREAFWRDAENEEELRADLEAFKWPKGEWVFNEDLGDDE